MSYIKPPQGNGLRLHFNENTAGCSPAVLEALRSIAREDVGAYPDYAEITSATERYLSVAPGWVQLTNGLDEGLHVVAQFGVIRTARLSDRAHTGTDHGPGPADARRGQAPSATQTNRPSDRAQTDTDLGPGPAYQERPPDRAHTNTDPGPGPAYARRGQAPSALIVEPAFEMYAACAQGVGLQNIHIAPEPDFRFPLETILASINRETRVVYLTDPNNPTGLAIPAGAVEQIAEAAPHALVLVDEAYAEFSGRTFIGETLDRHRNLIVGRTFAKAHGLAALRIGALVAHPDTLAPLRLLLPPYSLNIAAIRALGAAIADPAYLEWYVGQTVESRRLLYAFCERHQFTSWPSEANFVLMRVGPTAPAIVSALASRGVLIRDRSASPGCAGCIRITAGVVDHTRTCITELEDILASRAN